MIHRRNVRVLGSILAVIHSTALQDAAVLLTVAMDAKDDHELHALVAEFRAKEESDALTLAVVALCRSLCFATSKMIHVFDDALTDAEAGCLTEDELLPIAFEVVRSYAAAAAREAELHQES